MLVFSILAPSIIHLMDRDCSVAVLMDNNDEEKKENESEKKFGEKDLFLNSVVMDSDFFPESSFVQDTEHQFSTSDYLAEIFLPPPQQLV